MDLHDDLCLSSLSPILDDAPAAQLRLINLRKLPAPASNASSSFRPSFRLRMGRAFRAASRRKFATTRTPALRWKDCGSLLMLHNDGGQRVKSQKDFKQHESKPCDRLHSSAASARKLAASLWEQDPKNFTYSASRITRNGPATWSWSKRSEGRESCSGVGDGILLRNGRQRSSRYLCGGYRSSGSNSKRRPRGESTVVHDDARCELANALHRMCRLEEQHSEGMALISRLKAEVGHARFELQELSREAKSQRKEMEEVTKRLFQESVIFHDDGKETIVSSAIKSVNDGIEEERTAKRKLEARHRMITKDLDEVKKSLRAALEELDRETKARQAMETVCEELAREIGKDKAKLEEETLRVRQEVEEERRMLQMAEIWREERVQMKLTEAKLQLEEKNSALLKLQCELEALSRSRSRGGN